ncbi:nucleoporin NUP188-like [Tubulanus polymorphus]|uniref:nucleoporin NUP188-like n=1 Tax=Tubulanus polymorphus TaxID=672921 RepID=UPI003DA49743
MAAFEGSNKALWQFITGGSILRPQELVQAEITRSKDKLLQGLLGLKKCSGTPGSALKAQKKIDKGPTYEFVLKFSKFLDLDEVLAYDLFSNYLEHDYRGTDEELENALKDDRYGYALLLKLRDYYFTERLYLLLCIKHILSHWQDEDHYYKAQYVKFVESVTENDELIEKIIEQYTNFSAAQAPTWETHGQAMSVHQSKIWMVQNLKEQCELLEILLLYYKDIQHAPKDLLKILKLFKANGFGKHQTNRHLIDENVQHLVKRVGYLQVMVIIEGLDLEYLYQLSAKNSVKDHHILKATTEFPELNSVFCSLGDQSTHAPLLLAWTTIRHLVYDTEDALVTRKLGNTSLHLRVFDFLLNLLKSEPFCGKAVVASVCQYIVYGLLSVVLTVFHEDTLGDSEGLYAVAEMVLKRPFISEDIWEKGFDKGVGMLVQSASSLFPLEFHNFVNLCTSLATSDKEGANKVMKMLRKLPTYTEYLEQNSARDVENVAMDDSTWQLINSKRLYGTNKIVIPKGTYGTVISHPDRAPAIQWEYSYDCFQLLHCECELLLDQVAQGAGMVHESSVMKVLDIVKLLHTLLQADTSLLNDLQPLTSLIFPLIHRFSSLASPPLELIAACLDVLASLANVNPKKIWHNLQHTGFLPFLTENFTNVMDVASGSGLNPGTFGRLLSSYEIPLGTYPVTLSFLDLVANLVQPLAKENMGNTLLSSALFIVREIFPVFQKWRYYHIGRRETLGQKCLDIFHKILNIGGEDADNENDNGLSLRGLCVHCLLYTESGRALLDIVAIGVDTVELALSQQGSANEGIGVDLIQQIRFGFSVLNRLLLLRSSSLPPSPVEQALSTQPANRSQPHVIATIAQYIYHRHDPRLPVLSTLLLNRLAMVSPMSLMACLGNDASSIRDIFLSRLQSYTEDIRLKVVILELLSICVETQPGLTEMFLNIKLTDKSDQDKISKDKKLSETKRKELELGKVSCLNAVLGLLKENQSLLKEDEQIVGHCPPDLLCAVMEFIHALWFGRRETAMAVLRNKNDFWEHVCAPLRSNLPVPADNVALASDVKTASYVIQILALELYGLGSTKLDASLEKVLSTILNEKRIMYWSEYIRDMLILEGKVQEPREIETSESSVLHLLYGWRCFLVVMATYKGNAMKLDDLTKCALLTHVLKGLCSQFTHTLDKLKMKIATVASNLYFTLLRHWIGCLKAYDPTVVLLTNVLHEMSSDSQLNLPSVQIGVPGSLLLILQDKSTTGNKDVSRQCLDDVLNIICPMIVNGVHQLYKVLNSLKKENEGTTDMDLQIKPQVLLLNVLHELIQSYDNPHSWLPVLQSTMVLPTLVSALQYCIQVKQGIHYVQGIVTLFHSLAKIPQAAEALASNNLSQHLCLCVTQLYTRERYPSDDTTTKSKLESDGPVYNNPTWLGIYRLIINLVSHLLATLRYTFLQDALDFVGVHQDRLLQSLATVQMSLAVPQLMEAETTCHLLYELAHFPREWRLHLPHVWEPMMIGVCELMQMCISLFIRPHLLQHVLEKHVSHDSIVERSSPSKLSMSQLSSRIQTQSSTEDIDQPSKQLINGQYYLLRILSQGFSFLRKFSPDLCEIIIDQSMDVSEYEALLAVIFSTPSMDKGIPLSFGTVLACVNQVLRFLTKIDQKASSPSRTGNNNHDLSPITRTLLMFVLENALVVIMSQAIKYLKDGTQSPREKQFLKRELGTELNSFLQSFIRYVRRSGPPSPGGTVLLNRSISQTGAIGLSADQTFLKLVDAFVQQVLR